MLFVIFFKVGKDFDNYFVDVFESSRDN